MADTTNDGRDGGIPGSGSGGPGGNRGARRLAVVTGASSGIGFVAATHIGPQSWMAEAHRVQAEPSGEQR